MTATLKADAVQLLVVDIQEAFIPHIRGINRVIDRTCIMIEAANLLNIPIIVSEQYPKGLGRTVDAIQAALDKKTHYYDKTAFSVCGDEALRDAIQAINRPQALLAGIETHVCIAQTAFDLLEMSVTPFLPADALGSRRKTDHRYALDRLQTAGAIVTTTEAAIMEMIRHSKHPQFKAISKLIK